MAGGERRSEDGRGLCGRLWIQGTRTRVAKLKDPWGRELDVRYGNEETELFVTCGKCRWCRDASSDDGRSGR